MAPEVCPVNRRQRPGASSCRGCRYFFLGGTDVQGQVARRMSAELTLELVLMFLIAAAVLVGAGVVLTAPLA